jgi:ABC-type multidrug transport system fused ATPase/permease subunit
MSIRHIIKKNKYSISLVISCVLIENVAWMVEPSFFGRLLDSLIEHFYDHEKIDYLTPLLFWIFIYLLNVLGGTLSRFFSGKVYSKIYAVIATDEISKSKDKGYPASKILVRAELVKEYIVFLKERLPEAVWQFTASFGAMFALFLYDWRIAAVCLAVIIPMGFLNNLYRIKVTKLQKNVHDTQEEIFKSIENKGISHIREFYYSMVTPQTKIAKWSSLNYGVMKVLLLFVFIAILFICVDVDDFSTGKIYSIVSYLWTFIASTDYLPGLMESFTSVKDLNIRLEKENIEIEINDN